MSGNSWNESGETGKEETPPAESECENGVTKEDAPEWVEVHWLHSRLARRLIWFDIGLTLALTIVVIGLFDGLTVIENLPAVGSGIGFVEDIFGREIGGDSGATEPTSGFRIGAISVTVFALLGALGYVFTVLVTNIHRSTGKILRVNFRVVGAIPIGFGIFLLSDYILEDVGAGTLGLVFLTGLYVNLTYKRLGAIADHLLPPESDEEDQSQ